MNKKIKQHLEKFNFDIRKSGNARFMDQKVTPDVLSFIADCVENFICGDIQKEFTKNDIWHSTYLEKNTRLIFSKPSAKNETTKSEYDKLVAQPLKMLAYAKILKEEKRGTTNYYSIIEPEILSYIALKDRNAFFFLELYLKKILSDSDFFRHIQHFFELYANGELNDKSGKEYYRELRDLFVKFMIGNTKIGSRSSNGETEIRRIFPKILNIFSVQNNAFGVKRGILSDYIICYSDLMYNNVNFRDLGKEKHISRQDAIKKSAKLESLESQQTQKYNEYLVQKAITKIKRKYKFSEVRDGEKGEAIYVHHIFPKSEFPELSHYLENLIKLTANQHYFKAHPKGNTQTICRDYQLICLISKSRSIQESMNANEMLYSKPNFVFVINTGLSPSKQFEASNSFSEIESHLKIEYKTLLS